MKSVTINAGQAGKKIERVLQEFFPKLSTGALYKALRKKDIKVNGLRIKEGFVVKIGDFVEVYIIDDLLYGVNKPKQQMFDIVYEDDNLIIVNKYPGITVNSEYEAKNKEDETLIEQVQEYLNSTGSTKVKASLCHRLDRNTGGLLIIAKNPHSLEVLLDLIKNREITKLYKCFVAGKMPKAEATLTHFLEKDEKNSRVFINEKKAGNGVEIITKYRVLEYYPTKDISSLEVELVTGKTHQIRAHLAYIGHPIIGDGKYGTNAVNREFGIAKQQLWAYKLIFNFENGRHLNYLKGRTFEVKPAFSDKLF